MSRIVLLAVLAVAPWVFGGTEPDVEFRLYCGVMLALGLWVLSLLAERIRTGALSLRVPLVVAPVLLGIALGAFQLGIPETWSISRPTVVAASAAASESTSLVETVSGQHDSEQHSSDASASLPAFQGARTLSPAATRTQVARLVCAAVAILLGTALFATPASARWLWGMLAINGGALAFFGLVQQLSWNGKLFWTVPLRFGAPAFASFVNRNNAAGYLNLCLAGALAVLLACRRSEPSDEGDASGTWASPRRTPVLPIFTFGLMALIATGIVATSSRGGTLAMVAAGAVSLGLLFSRDRFRALAGAGAALVGLSLLLGAWIGLGDRVGERWKSASIGTFLQDNRWAHWRDAVQAVQDFPVFGAGLGTYRYAYLPYQQSTSGVRYFNADNQYVEGLLEGGFVGLALMLVTGLAGLTCVVSLARRSAAGTADPFVLAGAFALVSQGIAALFDFGPSIPATMLALAALAGSTAGRAAQRLPSINWSVPRLASFPVIRSAPLAAAICLAFLIGGAWSLRELSASSQAWRDRRSVPRLEGPDALHDEELAAAIARLERDAKAIPDDAETHQALAELLIYRFRKDEFQKGAPTSPQDRQRLWDATDPLSLAGQANIWARKGQLERVQMLAEAPAVRESLLPAAQHLHAARRACAWLPWADLTLATLRFVETPRDPAAPAELRRSLLVMPANDAAWFRAGLLADFAGEETTAWACWKRALVLDPSRLTRIRPLVAEKLSLSDQLKFVYPDSPELLLKLAEEFYAPPQEAEARYAVVDRALERLPEAATRDGNARRLAVLARGTALRDDGPQAIELYLQALQASPYNAEWRRELAETYRVQGDLPRALEQAEISLALAPGVRRTQVLVTELRRPPSAPSGPRSSLSKPTTAASPLPQTTPPSPSPDKSMREVGYRPLGSGDSPVKSP